MAAIPPGGGRSSGGSGSGPLLNTTIKLLVIVSLLTHLVDLLVHSTSFTNEITTSSSSSMVGHIIGNGSDSNTPTNPRIIEDADVNREVTVNETTTIVSSSSMSQQHPQQHSQHQQKKRPPLISLEELVNSTTNLACNVKNIGNNDNEPDEFSLSLVNSTIRYTYEETHPRNRKIPKIIHVTSRSKCMTKQIQQNIDRWKSIDGHNVYVHDDDAVDRLLYGRSDDNTIHGEEVNEFDWLHRQFPHLRLVARTCLISGAAKADLWRYLALYTYGGIYTDIDTAPGRLFITRHENNNNETSMSSTTNDIAITDDDDAWFVVERSDTLSQYFMAASPRHPLMFLAVQCTLKRLLGVDNIGMQYVPHTTGPGALKEAWQHFMRWNDYEEVDDNIDSNSTTDDNNDDGDDRGAEGRNITLNETTTTTDGEPEQQTQQKRKKFQGGVYVGMFGRTVTVIEKKRARAHIIREAVRRGKQKSYAAMGMKHFSKSKNRGLNMTCLERIYHNHHNNQ